MQKREKSLFCLSAACRSVVFIFRRPTTGFFFQRINFSLSLIPYPIRNSLPFTSLRSVTVGSGRDFLEGDTRRGQAQGLLELADYVPVVAAAAANVHGSTHAEIIAEDQAVRAVASIWSSTRCPIVAVGAHECQPTKEVDT